MYIQLVTLCPEISGGYVSNSLAIMTDAVHMLADVVGILFSLLALWLSTKPPTKRFTFGLHRLGKSLISEAFTFSLPLPLHVRCVVRGKLIQFMWFDAGNRV